MVKSEIINNIDRVFKNVKNIKISKQIIDLEGMSGTLYRSFINRFIKLWPGVNYLEIGCWKGSTAIAALAGNKVNKYYIIDNWHEFGGPRQEFESNFLRIMGHQPNLIDKNCFEIDPKEYGIKDIDVYFYDGGHSEDDQKKAITHYYDSFKSTFVLIVDDYNWPHVVSGTEQGIKESNLKIDHQVIRHTKANGISETWWNGVGVFVLSKS